MKKTAKFDYLTKCQIVHIQLNDIQRFCNRFLENGEGISAENVDKIQRMFKIVNEKKEKKSWIKRFIHL